MSQNGNNARKNNINPNLISQEDNFDKIINLNINNYQNTTNNNNPFLNNNNNISISNNNDQLEKNLIANDLFSIKNDDEQNNEFNISNININQLQNNDPFSKTKSNYNDSEIDQNQRVNFANDLFNTSLKTFTLAGSQNNLGNSSFTLHKNEMADELFGNSPCSSYKGSVRSMNQSNMSHVRLSGSNVGLNLNEIANKYAMRDQIIQEDCDEYKNASSKFTEEKKEKKSDDNLYADIDEEIEGDVVFKKNIASFGNNVFNDNNKICINNLDIKQMQNNIDAGNIKKKNNDLLRNSFAPNNNNENQKEDEKNYNNEINEKNDNNDVSNSFISIGGINIDDLPKFDNNNKIENVKNNNKKEKIENISNNKISNNIINTEHSENNIEIESKIENKEGIKQQKENLEKINLKNLFKKNNNVKKITIEENSINIKNNNQNNKNLKSNVEMDKDSDDQDSNDILFKKLKVQQKNKARNSKLKKGIQIGDYSVNDENKSDFTANLNVNDTIEKNKIYEFNSTENNISNIDISQNRKKKKIIIEESNKKEENEDDEKFLLIDINSIKNEKSFVEFLSSINNDFYFNKNIINDIEQIDCILTNTYFAQYILKNETLIDIILSKKSKEKIDIPYYYTSINNTYNNSKNSFTNIFQFVRNDDKKIFQKKFEQNIKTDYKFFDINNINICPFVNDINDFKACFLIESSENENYFFDYVRFVVEKDGDSFYRCFMFSLFEKFILNEKKDNIFMLLLDILKLYDLFPIIYEKKNVNIRNLLIVFCILTEYIELNLWEKVYNYFIYLYDEIDQALIIYLRYSIFLFLTKMDFKLPNNIDNKSLNQFMILISYYEPFSKIIFQSIPYIFGVNLDIKYYEGECGKDFFSKVKNILFTCEKNLKKRSTETITLFFHQNNYNIIYKNIKNNLILKGLNKISPINYSLLLDVSKFCNICNKKTKCVKIDYIEVDEFLCYDCLLCQIDIQLNKRISLFNEETNKNYSYYLRPIEILLQSYIKTKNNISTNIINITNNDFIHLYQKNFNERIAELIQAKDRLVTNNNINTNIKNENSEIKENVDVCIMCGKKDNIFQSDCGCKFCDDCAFNMLLNLTNQKIILNGYEKNIIKSTNKKLEYECCYCSKVIDINLFILFLEQSGKDFSEFYEDAKNRMKKYCQTHCFVCEKTFSNEKNIEVEHNKKKCLIRFNVIINDSCFRKGKVNEYEKDIDYSDTQHSICSECFKKTMVKHRNGSQTKTINDKDYQVIKCNICGIKHFIDQHDWDEKDKNNTCCKCGIF